MSSIEKVCEYSGDYDAHKMYEYKRNLIQINPEYRSLFRGKYFKLFRFLPDDYIYRDPLLTDYCLYVPELPGNVDGFYYNWTFDEWGIVRRKLKRLLQCRELKEIRIPVTMTEFQRWINANDFTLNTSLLLSEFLSEDTWLEIIEEVENEK